MIEKRASPRHRTLTGGSIIFGGACTVDCLVRNLSETGACLEVASPLGIRDDFTLEIKPEPANLDVMSFGAAPTEFVVQDMETKRAARR